MSVRFDFTQPAKAKKGDVLIILNRGVRSGSLSFDNRHLKYLNELYLSFNERVLKYWYCA